jgi:F1F0 ATPase subunit 2
MSEAFSWLLAGAAGLGLGALFFGGLWWTVRRGLRTNQPALWFLLSLLLRLVVLLAGVYVVGQGHWQRLLACLLGIVTARLILYGLTRQPQTHYAS